MARGRIAFVPPRYGPSAVGGSEAVLREMALGMAARGWDVEVLTSCALDHYTWENVFPPGESAEGGVRIKRFPTVVSPSHAGSRAERRMECGEPVPFDEQVAWLSSRFTVPGLFHHLLVHGAEFDAVILSPYLFWTTITALSAVPERAVTIPCLHDEAYARLDVLRPVLSDPAMVWFLSEPEHELAHRLAPVAPRHAVVGAGIHVPADYDPDGFRERHQLEGPFVLYAGRREIGKGWDWLVSRYRRAVEDGGVDLDLVTVGVGTIGPVASACPRIVDLGYLEPQELDNAFAAATAFVQPSRLESFSRTIMEAWLAGTPVLARADSDVVAWHCRQSGGGLLFSDHRELSSALASLSGSSDLARSLAERGRRYVLEHFTWDVVLDEVEAQLRSLG